MPGQRPDNLPVSSDIRTCAPDTLNQQEPNYHGVSAQYKSDSAPASRPPETTLSTSVPAGVYPAQDFNTRPGLPLLPEQVTIAESG